MLLLLCTSAPVVSCDQFDSGSRQVKYDLVDLLTKDYDITLCYSVIAFDERVTFSLQRTRLLPCACVFAALCACAIA